MYRPDRSRQKIKNKEKDRGLPETTPFGMKFDTPDSLTAHGGGALDASVHADT